MIIDVKRFTASLLLLVAMSSANSAAGQSTSGELYSFCKDVSGSSQAAQHKENYAASALAGLSGAVIAPDDLISATSFSE
jgi:hypothetical protein